MHGSRAFETLRLENWSAPTVSLRTGMRQTGGTVKLMTRSSVSPCNWLFVLLFDLLKFVELLFDECLLGSSIQHLLINLLEHVDVFRGVKRENDLPSAAIRETIEKQDHILDAPFLDPLNQ